MPKLSRELAAQVDNDPGSGSFDPVPAGVYRVRLKDVNAKIAKASGNPMWELVFEMVDDGYKGRLLWSNLVQIPTVAWKIREFFDAFGVGADTDTDELLGRTCRVSVIQRVIGGGSREGQIGNNIEKVLPDEAGSNGSVKVGAAAGAAGAGAGAGAGARSTAVQDDLEF